MKQSKMVLQNCLLVTFVEHEETRVRVFAQLTAIIYRASLLTFTWKKKLREKGLRGKFI